MTSADLNQQISKELHELRHATDNRSQERSWILAQLDNDKLEKEVLTLPVVAPSHFVSFDQRRFNRY